MPQFPAAIKVAVVPVTVQTPVVDEVNVTGKPDVAVAVSVTVEAAEWAAMALKVMV